MQILLIISLFLATFSIHTESNKQSNDFKNAFQKVLNKYDLTGTILIYDAQTKTFYSNDFEKAKKGQLPASTFKIPNSIIALETNVMDSDTTLIRWDGKKRNNKDWEKDMTLREAFQVSCVPCFQEIARQIGTERMNSYLQKLSYNNMIVNDSTLDQFWLQGKSKITAYEQIEFLEKLFNKELPIKISTYNKMMKIMQITKTPDYTLYGKTGWSINDKNNNGWFVGFIEKENKTYYFAVNVEPKDAKKLEKFIPGRKQAALEALTIMNIL